MHNTQFRSGGDAVVLLGSKRTSRRKTENTSVKINYFFPSHMAQCSTALISISYEKWFF